MCRVNDLKSWLVGAAIGRPPVKIRSDVNQYASAKKISAISPVGHPQIRHAWFKCELLSGSRRADERCSPLQNCGLLQSLIQTAEIYRLPPQYIIGPAQKRRFTFLIRIASAAAADERCSVLADGQFALRSCISILRQPGYFLRRFLVFCHSLNDRTVL